jgi:protein-tyrosine phosphatase
VGKGEGGPASVRSVQLCQEYGIDLSPHKRRQFTPADWHKYSVIAALDKSVFDNLNTRRPVSAKTVLVLFNAPDGVSDPFAGPLDDYRQMFQTVQGAMEAFLKQNHLLS